ncbi:MAG: hypothetical protein IPH04_17345 [Saprospirales bacterium]|nr:hypothetical protein [Saprospirales bacterium]
MKNNAFTSLALLVCLTLTATLLQAQNYSGPKPIQDFHRHNGYDPIYTFGPVNAGDTLAWIRFKGRVTDGIWHTGSNIMSWITGPVTNNSFPANLVFRTGDRMRMTIRDNGNVGVNTFLPEQLFTVSHPDLPVIRFDRSNGGERDFELFGGTNGNLFFRGGSDNTGPALSNFMVLTFQGRLGIGTDFPDQLLTVSNATTPVIRLDRSGAGERDYELFGGANGNLFFRGGADNTGAGLTNRMVLTHEGRLGLGTDEPDRLLTLSNTTTPAMRFDRSSGSEFDMELSLETNGNLMFRGGADDTGAGLLDLMMLTGEGKLAIGTLSTPASLGASDLSTYTIFAAGGILTEEVRVRTGWADYVFNKDHNLVSLPAVEEHILENGRLPGMPTTSEVEANGLELGDMTVRQQEKIEELFLYMIEMDKEMKALKKENEALKARVEKLER